MRKKERENVEINGINGLNDGQKAAVKALKTVRGQVDGIIKMIEGGRYCVDISNQIFASSALLRRANVLILKQHLEHCVRSAASAGNIDEKLDEIIGLLKKSMGR